jgi:tetratricopeptide (TPR) repeat protein
LSGPLLTVLIPNYGRTRYVERLIRQLAAEPELAGGEVHVVLSDNCSASHTREALRLLQAEFAQLPLEFHLRDENIGGYGNITWLIRHASTRFVWVIGNDDVIAPGALGYVLELLRRFDPAVLHLPHWFPGTERSPCPAEPQVLDSGRELFLNYHHWLSFISAAVVKRERLLEAIRIAPMTEHPWAPYGWYPVAGSDETCVVAARRVVGVGDAPAWHTHHANAFLTSGLISAFDGAFHHLVSELEYGRLLDARDADWHTPLWTLEQIEELGEAVCRFPSSRWLRRRYFEISLADTGLTEQEIGFVTGFISRAVRETEDLEALQRLLERGESAYANENFAEAIQCFQAVLAIEPTHAEALCDLGVAALASGSESGITALDYAITYHPGHADAYVNRALWAQARGLGATAQIDARRALEIDPSLGPALAAIVSES